MPGLDFQRVLSRGNWHRPGGVADKDLKLIDENISHWVQQQAVGDDIDALIERYIDSGYIVTRLSGNTHYFTAACGEQAIDFIQLEVEELQQVIERPLLDEDRLPDSIEELIDPVDFPLLPPQAVSKPYYQFRRISSMSQVFKESLDTPARADQSRFLRDWEQSSAAEVGHFCHHWILALREFKDSSGETRLSAKPISVFNDQLADLAFPVSLAGSELANALRSYDRKLGYPFAWYFLMLSSKSTNYPLAQAVLKDQMGAYDYLPLRDLKVLRQWEERPYAV